MIVTSGIREVPIEVVDEPLDGGPTRLEHTEERCRFRRFLTPRWTEHPLHRSAPTREYAAQPHPAPEPALDKSGIRPVERWRRVD
jgi:hypothetical protein